MWIPGQTAEEVRRLAGGGEADIQDAQDGSCLLCTPTWTPKVVGRHFSYFWAPGIPSKGLG